MPHMQDPLFSSSVIFICEHNKDGAMGLIINKKFEEKNLNNLFKKVYIENFLLYPIILKLD